MRALIADDDDTGRAQWATLMARFGNCDFVDAGSSALDVLRTANRYDRDDFYDLVVLDVVQPYEYGADLVEFLRRHENLAVDGVRTPVVVAGSGGLTSVIDDAFARSIDAFLPKPISAMALSGALCDLGVLD